MACLYQEKVLMIFWWEMIHSFILERYFIGNGVIAVV